MKIKHTPAPWEFLNDFGVMRIKGSAIEIAQIKITGDGEEDFDEAEANAQLIATAPDLLDALQKLVDANLSGSLFVIADAVSNAKSVITKATGGEK
jgi:hypothetical protein